MGDEYAFGEIRIFAGDYDPWGWMSCNGQLVPIAENETLFQMIGTTFGGDGQSTFALPNLPGPAPGCRYIICTEGMWPQDGMPGYMGQVRLFAGPFAIQDWPPCDGRILPIAENQVLFSLLETQFGGDGRQTFALPRVPGPIPHVSYIICTYGVFPE